MPKRLWLFLRIVWRFDSTETRMDWKTAWKVAGIVHPERAILEGKD